MIGIKATGTRGRRIGVGVLAGVANMAYDTIQPIFVMLFRSCDDADPSSGTIFVAANSFSSFVSDGAEQSSNSFIVALRVIAVVSGKKRTCFPCAEPA